MTVSELRNTMYSIVKNSGVNISGDFYSGREGSNNRPASSKLEDVVVNVLAGDTNQDQTFVVTINTFVPDIESGDEGYEADDCRIEYFDIFWSNFFEDYSKILNIGGIPHLLTASLSSAVSAVAVPGSNQHFVSVRLNVIVDKF